VNIVDGKTRPGCEYFLLEAKLPGDGDPSREKYPPKFHAKLIFLG
jgi:hypothetical protein